MNGKNLLKIFYSLIASILIILSIIYLTTPLIFIQKQIVSIIFYTCMGMLGGLWTVMPKFSLEIYIKDMSPNKVIITRYVGLFLLVSSMYCLIHW